MGSFFSEMEIFTGSETVEWNTNICNRSDLRKKRRHEKQGTQKHGPCGQMAMVTWRLWDIETSELGNMGTSGHVNMWL